MGIEARREKRKKERGKEVDRAASLPVTPAVRCRNSSDILIAENRSCPPVSVGRTGIS